MYLGSYINVLGTREKKEKGVLLLNKMPLNYDFTFSIPSISGEMEFHKIQPGGFEKYVHF